MSLLSYPKQVPEPIPPQAIALVNDAELIAQFLKLKNEAAFAAIVNRYGNMVFAVAVRIVRDRHTAEDVTQATFLLLAKDAKKIKRREALSSWLHGVAIRLAKKSMKRRSREQVFNVVTELEVAQKSFEEIHSTFEQQVLDEELEKLPAQYRDPLVLHYLQGKTYAETAQQLGVTLGAVEGRMKRGKRELQLSLTKRGVSLGAVIAALSWSQAEAVAAIQPEFIHTIAENGIAAFQGTAFTPACSPEAVFLAGKELTMLTTTKIAFMTLGLALAAGTGWVTHSGFADDGSGAGQVAQETGIETAVAQSTANNSNQSLVQTPLAQPKSPSQNDIRGNNLGEKIEITVGASAINESHTTFPGSVNPDQQRLKAQFKQLQAQFKQLEELYSRMNSSQDKVFNPGGTGEIGSMSGAMEMGEIGLEMSGGPPASSSTITVEKNQSPATEKIVEALESPNKLIEFEDNTLGDVMAYISDAYQIPVILDELALSEEGLSVDELVTFTMAADLISTRDALELMLDKIDLTYVVKNGVLMITTQVEAESHTETRVYDVRSLQVEDPEALTDVLIRTIAPDAWQESGGGIGDVSFLNGSLIVMQSQEVHEQIEVLLNQLANQVRSDGSDPLWSAKQRPTQGGGGGMQSGGGTGFSGGGGMF